ncbi:hypothetical protein OEZ85_012002 [Tetradesmus obliquus]|uniref:Programmed cell death protein 2 C-terminal domain-containing protein n=1 Tax=Tetradesmus obliquus TaxID=3088 RepID=A0ABY8TU70_TETOB|nr:hypothetical protein OEZ85_012002 [Tetradesmus obliquus]
MPARPDPLVESDDEQEEDVEYMLGFIDDPEKPTDLLRHRFPSKVGGVPAWLDPLNLPTAEQLTCGVTGRTLQFLLQVYCPVDDNPVDAFHRAIFLFVSPRGDELAKPGAVRALRCQLRRANPFYGDTPAPASQLGPKQLQAAEQQLSLERDPWKVATVEQQIAKGDDATVAALAAAGPALFVEQELIVEPEPAEDEEGATGAGSTEVQRLLAAYRSRVAAEGEYDEQELPGELVDELEGAAGPAARAFAAFQARTALAPEQCLRYCFQPGATPLWPSASRLPAAGDIPLCPHCGAQRRFEFQVMPQLLSLMELDAEDPHAPDWGTIAVYTCPSSCSPPPVQGAGGHSAYVEEFVWVQPS